MIQSKILSLDVGIKRIGLAVCDPLWLAVRPAGVIERRSRNEDFVKLAAFVKEQEIGVILCGLPLNMDGSEGERAKSIRKWAMRLAQAMRALLKVPIPLVFWDERLSTYAAQQILYQDKKQHDNKRAMNQTLTDNNEIAEDAAAAAVILQSYLDAQQTGEVQDFSRIELSPL